MAVKIRLKRMGAKKAPFYRIVVPAAQEMVASLKKLVTITQWKSQRL